MSGLRMRLILVLLGLSIVSTPTVLADSWQRPRKEPEVVKEKEKPRPDNKDQGNNRKKDDQKKKDNPKKPN